MVQKIKHATVDTGDVQVLSKDFMDDVISLLKANIKEGYRFMVPGIAGLWVRKVDGSSFACGFFDFEISMNKVSRSGDTVELETSINRESSYKMMRSIPETAMMIAGMLADFEQCIAVAMTQDKE